MSSQKLHRTTDIALAAIFGALIAFSSFIPVSVIVGGIGVFNLAWVMQTLAGILLGPVVGGGAATAGGVVGELINPSLFGILGFLRPTLGALQAGLIVWGRWYVSALILGSLIVSWFLLPTGAIVWPMAIFHVIGFVIILAFGKRLPFMIRSSRARSIFIAWLLTAYSSNITRHLFGNIWLAILSYQEAYFWAALPFTAIEQAMFALASAMIGVAVLSAVREAGSDIPLTRPSENASKARAFVCESIT